MTTDTIKKKKRKRKKERKKEREGFDSRGTCIASTLQVEIS